MGSGLVGSLAYAFSDTFWFSAVEGEVYATSSLFTAVVFWAILKWENIAEEKYADRWLILIAYLMGLSIGVHLLNLLAIPAIVLVYYFRRYKPSTRGLVRAVLISILLLGVIMYGIIQGLVLLAEKFELLFVNQFGLPFNSGVIFFTLFVIAGIPVAILYTKKRKKYLWNTILTGLAVMLIGFSSYTMIVIRSLANPTMDMNNPENIFNLRSYLNREQYGQTPLLTGHHFSDRLKADPRGYVAFKDTKPVYEKDTVTGKYEIIYRESEPLYEDPSRLFPRMYSRDNRHMEAYREWSGLREGEKVSFSKNLRFFFSYQLGHMYFRYFMWNFTGRQNDHQSHGSLVHGNWISGIKFIDELRLGDQDKLPDRFKNMDSRNRYYFLPLLFGLLGFFFHISKDIKNFWVVMLLFFFTGIAIVIYLNQTPYQPRERDYAYAGSFYAFSIWIGFGVLAVYDSFKKLPKKKVSALALVFLILLIVPFWMAKENWDDHDRSHRYIAREIAKNYLRSCEPNAILFTNGDNDTYPLWYVQEVEGFRTDVRVINLMLVNSDWNIRQLRTPYYESDIIPLSLSQKHYDNRENSSFYIIEDKNRILPLREALTNIENSSNAYKRQTPNGDIFTVIPSNRLQIPVDSIKIMNDSILSPENVQNMESPLEWTIPAGRYLKNNLVQLDILSGTDWERPVYFVSGGNKDALNLEQFFRLEGLAYRVVPYQTTDKDFFSYGMVNTDILYEKLMGFSWGNIEKDGVNVEYQTRRTMNVIQFRQKHIRLAESLLEEGDTIRAIAVLDRCMEIAPHEKIPYDTHISGMVYPQQNGGEIRVKGVIETYYRCRAIQKANELVLEFSRILMQDIDYYNTLRPRFRDQFASEYFQSAGMYRRILEIVESYGQAGELIEN